MDTHTHTNTDLHKISEAFKQFYKNLYKQEQTCPTTQDRFLQYAKPLKDTDKTDLETPFTLEDFTKMKLNKTPGPDGLTTEFYQHLFQDLGPILLKMIQEAHTHTHKNQTVPDSLSLSYITLLPKDNPDETQMKSYRPIVDYKIISKVITNKLQPNMSKLIHADQQCSIVVRKNAKTTYTLFGTLLHILQKNKHRQS